MEKPLKIIDRATGKELPVPPEGALGLLALGDITVKPWRQVRMESGYEKELLERVKAQAEESKKRREELMKKRKELQQQKLDEQKKS